MHSVQSETIKGPSWGQQEAVPDTPQHGSPRRAAADVSCEHSSGLPNLFVVGGIKSGTTALYHFFKYHPQIFVPASIKETNYMALYRGLPPLNGPRDVLAWTGRSITTLDNYRWLYAHRTVELLAADVSPCYLYYPQAAEKIAELCPDAKIVMVLRDPVECAFSMYAMMRRDGREPCRNFREAFRRSPERIAAGWEWAWDYQHCPMYAQQVAGFLRRFPPSQLFIRRYLDLKNNPYHFFGELNDFLGTSAVDVWQANRKVNTSPTRGEMLRKRRSGRWLLRLSRAAGLMASGTLKARLRRQFVDAPAFSLSAEDRMMLIDHFAPDILKLARTLSWDLSSWLMPK